MSVYYNYTIQTATTPANLILNGYIVCDSNQTDSDGGYLLTAIYQNGTSYDVYVNNPNMLIYYYPNEKVIADNPTVNFNIDQSIYGRPYFAWDSTENNRLRSTDDVFTSVINTFTNRNPPCFNEGSKILCLTKNLKEEYRLVQDLIVGDIVKSYIHGYRPISKIIKGSLINTPNEIKKCMYRMKKTDDNGLIEDLIITGCHGILVDELNDDEKNKNPNWANYKIDNKFNLISSATEKFEKLTDNNLYNFYHLSLYDDEINNRRFGVWANGILVETPSIKFLDNFK
jgi:hypothetical protein